MPYFQLRDVWKVLTTDSTGGPAVPSRWRATTSTSAVEAVEAFLLHKSRSVVYFPSLPTDVMPRRWSIPLCGDGRSGSQVLDELGGKRERIARVETKFACLTPPTDWTRRPYRPRLLGENFGWLHHHSFLASEAETAFLLCATAFDQQAVTTDITTINPPLRCSGTNFLSPPINISSSPPPLLHQLARSSAPHLPLCARSQTISRSPSLPLDCSPLQ